ncbi:DUF6607 family protein [Pseudoblastomonas halimionae]|uniref:Uncharacterized protein n=1 Tax=Alteriqipengyuania halimionae TaxID=1926630 RepID=A0A6I4U6Q2_9SPHN|nr:DUF6607 family protein [Alteriqipengyuania halimionae]MXP10505.1 hypothetical protein [Alteriqipengyuania halimionae]
MKLTKNLIRSALLATALVGTPAMADGPIKDRGEAVEQAHFQRDRETILAMAGDYKVRFDMQESTPWMDGYEPLDRKISGGYESVRVIEDTGTRIVLQHLLVVGDEGEEFVIKHWRQDWEYEPEKILTYTGPDTWEWVEMPERLRNGRWSQTVYQVDDSPRYAGWGEWQDSQGIRRWRSNWTTRPLARRDAVRDPVYDRYEGINRHQLTPTGWIHWQDNTKMMPDANAEDGLAPVVQEYVLNTYTRFDGYNTGAADAYWAATRDYWKAVRGMWDEVAAANGGITIAEEAQTGTVISGRLLTMGNAIQAGEMSEADAIAEARTLITEATAPGVAAAAKVAGANGDY